MRTISNNLLQRKRLLPSIGLLLLCLSIVLIVTSCGSTGAVVKPYASGGLGLTRAEWEQHHVLDVSARELGYIYDVRNNQRTTGYGVEFWTEQREAPADARVSHIAVDTRYVFSDTQNLDWYEMARQFPKMQAAVRYLLPADAQLVKTDQPLLSRYGITEIYHSESLKDLYPTLPLSKDPWEDEAPGTIHAHYSGEGALSSVSLSAGPSGIPRLPTLPPPPTDTPLPTYPYVPPVPTAVLPAGTARSLPAPAPMPSRPAAIP